MQPDDAMHSRRWPLRPVAAVVPRQLVGTFTDGKVVLGDHNTRRIRRGARQRFKSHWGGSRPTHRGQVFGQLIFVMTKNLSLPKQFVVPKIGTTSESGKD